MFVLRNKSKSNAALTINYQTEKKRGGAERKSTLKDSSKSHKTFL